MASGQFDHRVRIEADQSIGYFHPHNKRAVFLVHGLGGNNTEKYWGRLIELMNYDSRLKEHDFYYWRYKTSRWITWPPITRPSKKERISTVPEVALALADDLLSLTAERSYTAVSMIGHSLGGLISLLAGEILATGGRVPLRSICAMASPTRDIFWAWMANAIFQDMNPHIHFLAQSSEIRGVLEKITKLNAGNIHTSYMHFIGDGFLYTYRRHQFSEFIAMQGPHSWMPIVRDRDHTNYRLLTSYIKRWC
jgi:pimeloyl-ACP methyl ester carboxylesterase